MKSKIIIKFNGKPSYAIAFEQILAHVKDPKCDLIELLRSTSYDFKSNKFSSRMLNHYENKGWINAERKNIIGKRWFSLFGMFWLNLNISSDGLLNKAELNSSSDYDVYVNEFSFAEVIKGSILSPFELLCMLSIVLFRIDYVAPTITNDGDNIEVNFKGSGINTVDFSHSIFDYLNKYWRHNKGYENRQISNHKSLDDFMVSFIYNIDVIRNKMGANLLCPQVYNAFKRKQQKHINVSHRNDVKSVILFSIGENIMTSITNLDKRIVKDENGDCYAVEVTYLGKAKLVGKIVGERKLEKLTAVFKPEIDLD